MTVVPNTTPLNYLVLISEVEILHRLLGSVTIPNAVRDELSSSDAPPRVRAWIATPPSWLHIEDAPPNDDVALHTLHPGEREAIALAEAKQADLLLLDERAARAIAAERHVPITGTLGVLLEASMRGLTDLTTVVPKLQQTTFRASPKLYRWLLDPDRS